MNQAGLHDELLHRLFIELEIMKNKPIDPLGAEPDITETYNRIAETYFNKGDLDNALKYYLLCFEIRQSAYQPMESGKPHRKTVLCYQSIGRIYMKQKKYDMALDYLQKFIDLCEEAFDNDLGLQDAENNPLDVSMDEHYLNLAMINETMKKY